MQKINLSQTLSVLANIGVIASIVFLALETRQSTIAIQLQTAQSYTSEMNATDYFILENPYQFEITGKILAGEEITPEEGFRNFIYYRILFRVWQSAFYQSQNGTLDDRFLEQLEEMIRLVLDADPSGREYWREHADRMDPLFEEFVNSIIFQTAFQGN